MSRLGIALRLLVLAGAFSLLVGPHWLALRFGRPSGWAPVLFHRLALRLFSVRVTQSGTPPAPGTPALVLANHVSWLDIAALGSLRPLSFVAKSEIAGWPVIGWFAVLQQTVFIDRARRGATAEVNRTLGSRLAAGELIVLFAEGTTGDGTRLLPFRSSLVGAARNAIEAEEGRLEHLHLQPLALAYPRRNGLPVTRGERPDVAWYGDMDLAPHLATFVREGPLDVHVSWGAPIVFEAGTDRKRATAQAEAAVRGALRAVRAGQIPSGPAAAAPAGAGLPETGLAPV